MTTGSLVLSEQWETTRRDFHGRQRASSLNQRLTNLGNVPRPAVELRARAEFASAFPPARRSSDASRRRLLSRLYLYDHVALETLRA